MSGQSETTEDEDQQFIYTLREVGFLPSLQRIVINDPDIARRWVRNFDSRIPDHSPEEAKNLPIDKIFKDKASTTLRSLRERDIRTLGDLTERSRQDLEDIPGISTGRRQRLEKKLALYKLSLLGVDS